MAVEQEQDRPAPLPAIEDLEAQVVEELALRAPALELRVHRTTLASARFDVKVAGHP
jgi:hypothetical protein